MIEDAQLIEALNQLKEGHAGFSQEMSEEDVVWRLFEFYMIAVSNELKCVDYILRRLE